MTTRPFLDRHDQPALVGVNVVHARCAARAPRGHLQRAGRGGVYRGMSIHALSVARVVIQSVALHGAGTTHPEVVMKGPCGLRCGSAPRPRLDRDPGR